MTSETPLDSDTEPFEIDFDPVPRRNRIDGWSPEKQRDLVSAYAETGCITQACERVGMSRNSYYKLDRAPESGDFRRAMAAAAQHCIRRVEETSRSRCIHGDEIPHYYKGELVSTHKRYPDRLIQFMLQKHMPETYGTDAERAKIVDTSEAKAIDLEKLTRKVAKPRHDREIRDIPFAIEMEKDFDEYLDILSQEEFVKQAARVQVLNGEKGRIPPDILSTLSTSAGFHPSMFAAKPDDAPTLPGAS